MSEASRLLEVLDQSRLFTQPLDQLTLEDLTRRIHKYERMLDLYRRSMGSGDIGIAMFAKQSLPEIRQYLDRLRQERKARLAGKTHSAAARSTMEPAGMRYIP